MPGSQIAFFPQLEAFTTKYLVIHPQPLSPAEEAQAPQKIEEVKRGLFEQLMLFDKLAIRIHAENLPLAMMMNMIGDRWIEELIDQDALRFVQWKPTIFHMVSDVKGVDALAFGDLKSEPLDDPEASIDMAFDRLTQRRPRNVRRLLKRKILPLYQDAETTIAKTATELTKSAYLSGKLTAFELPPDFPYGEIPLPLRAKLRNVASEIAEYNYVLKHGMTSLSNYTYFTLLSDTAQKLAAKVNQSEVFSELAQIEHFPDLKSIYPTLSNPLQQVIRLRDSSRSRWFRQWLSETKGDSAELTKEYISAIAGAHGPLDTTTGKFIKAIAMTAISGGVFAGIGSLAGLVLGSAAGAAAMTVGRPVLETGLDLLDQFVLDGLLKGWNPRMFFDDLRALEHTDLRTRH